MSWCARVKYTTSVHNPLSHIIMCVLRVSLTPDKRVRVHETPASPWVYLFLTSPKGPQWHITNTRGALMPAHFACSTFSVRVSGCVFMWAAVRCSPHNLWPTQKNIFISLLSNIRVAKWAIDCSQHAKHKTVQLSRRPGPSQKYRQNTYTTQKW